MSESILESSCVFLFGREITDLEVKPDKTPGKPPRKGANRFLGSQFAYKEGNKFDAKLARIYAFSFEGVYFELSTPAVFLVHGKGEDPNDPAAADPRLARMPSDAAGTGLGAQTGHFSRDIRCWVYDRHDFTMRLDVSTGDFNDLLIGPEIAAHDPMAASSGMLARQSGMLARQSGMLARQSGMLARSSGMLARSSGMLARGGGSD